jgi:hypothetical protein
VERARPVVGVRGEHERPHRPDRQAREGPQLVQRHGVVALFQRDAQVGDLAQVEVAPALGPPPEVGMAQARVVARRQVAQRRIEAGGDGDQGRI